MDSVTEGCMASGRLRLLRGPLFAGGRPHAPRGGPLV